MNNTWHHLYEFWVGEQGVPGSLLGDFLVFMTTYLIGKYKVAPWIHKRHTEHLDQKERQHQEILAEHRKLYDLHSKHQRELIDIVQNGVSPAAAASPVPAPGVPTSATTSSAGQAVPS